MNICLFFIKFWVLSIFFVSTTCGSLSAQYGEHSSFPLVQSFSYVCLLSRPWTLAGLYTNELNDSFMTIICPLSWVYRVLQTCWLLSELLSTWSNKVKRSSYITCQIRPGVPCRGHFYHSTSCIKNNSAINGSSPKCIVYTFLVKYLNLYWMMMVCS